MSTWTKPDGLGDEGRDPALERLYAAGAREEPPARLDAAILAAAHREVRSRPRRLASIVRASRVPVSIAAVVVLSASLVMLMQEEKADRFYEAPPPAAPPSAAPEKAQADAVVQADAALRPQASPSPKAVPSRSPDPASPPAPAAEREAPRMEDRQARNDGPRPAQTVPPAPQPFPVPAPTGEERGRTELRLEQPQEKRLGAAREAESGPAASGRALDRSAGVAAPEAPPARPLPQSDALAKQRVEGDTGTRGSSEQLASSVPELAAKAAPPPPAKARPRARLAESAARPPIWSGYERQPPDKWLERIADLRRTDRHADAREMLEEFRKRFPDYPVPEPLTR